MKKRWIVLLFICLIGAGGVYYFSSAASSQPGENLQSLLARWDQGEVEEAEKNEIMARLMEYTRNTSKAPKESLPSLSNQLSVMEAGELSIVEYIENPAFYGSSGRESYHFAAYNDRILWFDNKGSMRVDHLLKRADDLYYMLATDYRMSMITGIQLFELRLNQDELQVHPLLTKVGDEGKFTYDSQNHILYYDNGHLYWKEIAANGEEIAVTNGDEDFVLKVAEDGLYRLSSSE
ncbi:hypothetical protein [Paenibacillus sp. 598K]|uniref:hypothetical protein n=1 Tax=Paenibacillus sp. 598K TaxID=1117987 RepID=UPI000FFE8FC3|nr:hypothetical protein [Paenibacillus sp. 598K]